MRPRLPSPELRPIQFFCSNQAMSLGQGIASKYFSGFNPLVIPGCTLWLDAADQSTLTLSGSNVSQWNDKSVNGNHVSQATGSNQPTYSSNGVLFDGVNDFLRSTVALSSFITATDYTVFLYGVNFTVTAGAPSYTGPMFIADENGWFGIFISSSQVGAYNWDGNADYVGAPYATSNAAMVTTQHTGGVLSASLFGNTATTGASGNTGNLTFQLALGRSFAGAFYTNCRINELMIYNRALTTSEIRQVEGYLSWKWGPRMYIPSTSTFLPTQISGCQLWLDAADISTITFSSGSNVSQWNDKSGNGFHVSQATPSNNPVYANGRMTFTGGTQWLSRTATVPAQANAGTLITVARHTATRGRTAILRSGFMEAVNEHGTAAVLGYYNSTNSYDNSPSGVNFGTNLTIVINRRNGASTPQYTFNGGPLTNYGTFQGGAATKVSSVFIGRNPDGLVPLSGDICEVIFYNVAITETERQQVETYLGWKWNIAIGNGIPVIHPYYPIVPVTRPFVPLDISACALWLDAADPSTLTLSGTNVTVWADKSGNGRNTSAVTGTPVLSNNSIISRQGVYFGGTSYFTGPLSYSSNTLSWFIVGTMESGGDSVGRILSFGSPGAYDFDSALRLNAASREGLTTEIVSYRNAYIARNAFVTYGAPFIFSGGINGASNSPFFNGTGVSGAATSGNFGFTEYGISASSGLSPVRNKGFIFEILVYTNFLTTTQRQQIEGYLANKWGLQGPSFSLSVGLQIIPTQISGLTLWLDAADSSSYTMSGTNLATWTDKSSNAYVCSPVSGNSITQSTQNGQNVFYFNNTRALISNFVWTNASTVFLVTRSVASAFLYSHWTTNYTNYIYIKNASLFNVGNSVEYRDSVNPANTPVQALNTWGIFTIGYNPATSSVTNYAVNGTVRAVTLYGGTPPGAATTTTTLYINGNGTTPFDQSFVAEILHYNRSMTTDERQQIEGYLAQKWGIRSALPITHPYYGTAGLPITHPFRTVLPATTSFNPRQITECALWLDAADPASLTLSGSNVTTWRDKSGGGWNATAQTGNATYSSNGVVFTGAQMLQTSLSAVIPNQSFFCIASSGSNFSNMGIVSVFSSNLATGYNYTLAGNQQLVSRYGGTVIMSGTNFAQNTRFLYNATVTSGGSSFVYANGIQTGSNTSTPAISGTGATVSIGAYYLPSDGGPRGNFTGTLNEIIIFSNVLTATQRQQVEGYLAWKWGLQTPSLALSVGTITPTQISGLSFWLDATDASTITLSSGSNISQWRDKSSNAFTGTAINSPTYVSNSMNGFVAVNFNGTTQYVDFGNVLNIGTSQIYVFVVAKYDTTASGALVAKSSFRGLAGRWALWRDTGNMIWLIDTSGSGANTTFADTNTNTRILTATWNRSATAILENGTQRGTVSLSTTVNMSNTDPLYVGAYQNSTGTGPLAGYYFTGKVGEVLVYLGSLTTVERQQVENYLAQKWGLLTSLSSRGLPSTHPYSKISPI